MKTTRFFPGRLAVAGGIIAALTLTTRAQLTTNLIPVADTSLQEAFPDNNFGGGTTFVSGGRNMGGRARALLQFNIAGSLPAGAAVNSVSLTLSVSAEHPSNSPDSTFDLRRALAAWGEGAGSDLQSGSPGSAGEATWNNRLGPGNPWTNVGGDFAGAASASQFIAGVGPYNFSGAGLAADVQMWLDNPGTNFGWILVSQAENTAGTIRRFASRLAGGSAPTLSVNYTVSTPPTSPTLFDVALVANQIRFSFAAESNRTYAVEFRNALTNGSWSSLTNIPALPSAMTLHIITAVSGLEGYFRVRTP